MGQLSQGEENFLDRAKRIAYFNVKAGQHSFNVGLYEFIKLYDPIWTIAEYIKQESRLKSIKE